MALAEVLMQAVDQTIRLEAEAQMDTVTAVSGSGLAYVVLLIEALAERAWPRALQRACLRIWR